MGSPLRLHRMPEIRGRGRRQGNVSAVKFAHGDCVGVVRVHMLIPDDIS